jgi:hypothetical protein
VGIVIRRISATFTRHSAIKIFEARRNEAMTIKAIHFKNVLEAGSICRLKNREVANSSGEEDFWHPETYTGLDL